MSSFARRSRLAAALAPVVAAALIAPIPAAAAGPAGGQRIYACVTPTFKTLNLTSRQGRCEPGEQKISWAVEGPRGETGARGRAGRAGPAGARGPAGPAGAPGAAGAAGVAGPIGPASLVGPVGPIGPQGVEGPRGAEGAQGVPGPQGPEGPPGSQGVPGASGADGAPGPTSFLASGPGAIVMNGNGAPGIGTALPLSGITPDWRVSFWDSVTQKHGLHGDDLFTAQVVPTTTNIRRMKIVLMVTEALALPSDTEITVTAMVIRIRADEITDIYASRHAGAGCTIPTTLRGAVAEGTLLIGDCVIDATIDAGDFGATSILASSTGTPYARFEIEASVGLG